MAVLMRVMRNAIDPAVVTAAFLLVIAPDVRAQETASPAPQAACTKAQFEAVVDEASAALSSLNQEKKPDFEDRLRQLKDKRGWTHEEFLKAAAPFVKDETIDVFDTKSNTLLEELSTGGEGQARDKPPDCAALLELRAKMTVLVETQNSKWTYMFGKLDAELQK